MTIGYKTADFVKRHQIILIAAVIHSSEPVGEQGKVNDDHTIQNDGYKAQSTDQFPFFLSFHVIFPICYFIKIVTNKSRQEL